MKIYYAITLIGQKLTWKKLAALKLVSSNEVTPLTIEFFKFDSRCH